MEVWQQELWRDVLAGGKVLPPANGALLVLGDGRVADFIAAELAIRNLDDILVAHCAWGDPPATGLAYDRVLLVADDSMADYPLALSQVGQMLRHDGKLVVVAARPWPWGVYGSVWSGGESFVMWKRWLRWTGWRLEYASTHGQGWRWLRLLPASGIVRLMVAKKRIGGTRVPVERVERPRVVEPRVVAGPSTSRGGI